MDAEKNIYQTMLNRKFDMSYKEDKTKIKHYILKQKYKRDVCEKL